MNTTINSLVIVGLPAFVLVSAALGQSASATVVAGSERCRDLHFPGGWQRTSAMRKAQMDHFLYGWDYEFRKTVAVTQEYLVAAVDGFAKDYSGNKFWVNLRSGQVRSATDSEWKEGMVVPRGRLVKGPLFEPKTEEGVLFVGKLFRKSGPQWPLPGEQVRISTDEKWIAVQSWEGRDYHNGDIIAPRGGYGKFFIDLYDVASGRRFAAIEGTERGSLTADEPLGFTFWLESRYFIVQLGSHLERMLVCEVPNQ